MSYYTVKPDFIQVPGDIIVNSYPGHVLISTERVVDENQIVEGLDPDQLYTDYITELQSDVKTTLMEYCDERQIEAIKAILGYKATNLQLERYADKYKRAKAGEWSDEVNNAIITNHEYFLAAIRAQVDIIEYFRMATDDLIIASKIEDAKVVILAMRELPLTATTDDVDAIFTNLSNT